MCVSALKSEGWNFAKFGKVRSIDPIVLGIMALVSDIIKKQDCTAEHEELNHVKW